jgi:4-hydroxymandelate oxidase
VGRPVIWGLAVGRAPGVSEFLTGLTAELAHTMTLCGLSDVRSVPRDSVARAYRAG